MNRPIRNRFLQILRDLIPADNQSSNNLQSERDRIRNQYFRTPQVESLEGRRVMAANITQFTPTDSGFVVQFSEAIDSTKINLYTTSGGAMGQADVTVQGATSGAVKGSAVFTGNTMTFVASGGVLPADTYTVTLRSAADGFTDAADGELLDGEKNSSFPSGNGTAGGNFVTTFTVSAGTSVSVGLADIARGPGQALQGPASGSGSTLPEGLAIQLGNAAGVTSLTMTFQYDPTLMNISEVKLGPDAPSGSQVQANLNTPGVVTLSFFALTPLTADQTDIISVIATVPETATYGKAQVLDVTAVEVNAGALTAKADDAIHVAAFPGDVNANRRYDAEDARLIARVGVGSDTGFVSATPTSSTVTTPLYPLIDPRLLGDVTGVDGISPLDASDVLRKVIGLSVPNLPNLPSQAPTNIALSATSVTSGSASGTTVGTFTSTDPDTGDTFTYSLVSGTGDTDNSSFTISGNQLKTAAVFNAATKSSYSIRVRTSDSSGKSFEKSFTITVSASNQAPTDLALSSASVAESQTTGAVVGSFTTTDPDSSDTFTYSLVSGVGSTDNGAFTINNNQLVLNTPLNFEAKPSYAIRVRTTDNSGATFEKTLTIAVTNVNEAPTQISSSGTTVPAGATSGTTVGTLTSTDPDASDTHTYTLVSGTGDTDNSKFTITGNQLKTNATFTSQTTFSIRVRSTDAAGLTFEQVITGTVAQENAAPTDIALSSNSIAENSAAGSIIGNLTSSDPNSSDTHTYALVAGTGDTDNAAFTITGNQLKLTNTPDFETKSSYSIRVQTTDNNGLTFAKTFTINVTNVNEAPTDLSISLPSIAENTASGTTVGQFTTIDTDSGDTHTYALVSGTGDSDNASFTIDGNSLKLATTPDFETKGSYAIRVRSTDAGGLSTDKTLTIGITNVNEAPTQLELSANTVVDGTASGQTVATLSATDVDASDSLTYSLTSGTGDTDNASFTISGSNLVLASNVDLSAKSLYSLRVKATDTAGLSTEQSFTINVTAAPAAAPTAINLSSNQIAEEAAIGTTVGLLTSVDANNNDTHSYTLVAGAGDTDNAAFAIVGNELRTVSSLDFETKSSYSIRVRTTDSSNLTFEQSLPVNITNVNEAPSQPQLNVSTVVDGTSSGQNVATISSPDPDSGDTHTYSLVSGSGDTDNASFTISGNNLVLATTVNMANKSSYAIRVKSTDNGGLSSEQSFVITVTEAPVAPTAINLSATQIAENQAIGTGVGQLTSTDASTADTHTYALVAGTGDTDNAAFEIVNNELRTKQSFDFETKSSYNVRIQTTDSTGLTYEQAFVVTVANVNEAPTAVTISSNTIADMQTSGTVVGMLGTTDPDAGDTFTYTLVTGTGDTDNSVFQIVGGNLVINENVDAAIQSLYNVRVKSTDAAGLEIEQVLQLLVQ